MGSGRGGGQGGGRGGGKGVGTGLSRVILVIINTIFLLIGIALLAGGIVILVGNKYFEGYIDKLLNAIPGIVSGAGISDGSTQATSVDASSVLDVKELLKGLSIMLIILGGIIFIIAMLGCCGACCKVKWMLVVYGILMGIIVLAQLVVIIVIFTGKFSDVAKTQLKKTLAKFKGIDSYTTESITWNAIQISLKCCGVEGHTDFAAATQWNKDREYEYNGQKYTFTQLTPLSCCKFDGTLPDITPKDSNCSVNPTDINNNWKMGCWNALRDEVSNYKTPAVIGCAGVLLLEILLIVLAVVIFKSKKDKVEPVTIKQ